MPSLAKCPKTKPLKKLNKSIPIQLKTQPQTLKNPSLATIFKTLELETACELPSIEDEKHEKDIQISQKSLQMKEKLPPSVVQYENGLQEVDLWQPCPCKNLWDSLIDL